jgi:2-oxoglutarate ferredoxin oxidoreductase subunit delta
MAAETSSAKKKSVKKSKKSPRDVKIYRAWCKSCGICVAFCPKGALEMGSDGPEWKNPDQCIGCRMCEYRCPDFAIEVVEEEKGDAPE